MSKRKWAMLLAGALVLGMSGGMGSALAQDKPIELTFSNFFPAPHKNSVLIEEYAKAIGEKTGGKVKVTLFHGGTLTPAAQVYDGVTKSLSDMGMSSLGYTRGRFPLTEIIDLPLGYKSGLAATKVANAYLAKFQPKELTDTQVMFLHAHGPGVLHTKKPVANLADLKGTKVSCTGLSAKIVEKLGAVPVAAPMPERYDSISKGVSDGGMFPVEALKGWKLAEVVKSTTLNFGSAYTTAFFVTMNKDKWASLSPEIQKVFNEVNAEYIVKFGEVWDAIDKEGSEFAKTQGVTTIALTPEEDAKWSEAVKPILAEYTDNMAKKSLPGAEALEFCTSELKKYQQ
jgi:TRAP-type C4-dicarboxylate transport system substrate-binding protein